MENSQLYVTLRINIDVIFSFVTSLSTLLGPVISADLSRFLLPVSSEHRIPSLGVSGLVLSACTAAVACLALVGFSAFKSITRDFSRPYAAANSVSIRRPLLSAWVVPFVELANVAMEYADAVPLELFPNCAMQFTVCALLMCVLAYWKL